MRVPFRYDLSADAATMYAARKREKDCQRYFFILLFFFSDFYYREIRKDVTKRKYRCYVSRERCTVSSDVYSTRHLMQSRL